MSSKTKILLILSRNIFELNSAGSNRYRSIAEYLTRHNIEIELIITQGYGSFTEYKKYRNKGKIDAISYTYTLFLFHTSLWLSRISGYLLSPLLKNHNAKLVRKKITVYDPQIIWIQSNLEVFNVYLTANYKLSKRNHKLMLELNEFHDIGLVHSTNKLQLELSKCYSKTLLTQIIPKVDLLLIMTRHLLEYYQQYTDSKRVKIIHLPMTVDLSRFNLKKKVTNERYIAYCGSSSFLKDGVDVMIKSFSLISLKYPEVKLKIAAFMEADGMKMLSLINHLNMQDHIEYVGELNRNEIPDFITSADLLVLPRPDTKQARGGFPTKLGEYLATGNPVCATEVGEIPDYLIDNQSVFFAVPGNIESFANAMDRALSDPVIATEVGKRGKQVAELYFNLNVQGERLLSFLNTH